MRKGIQRTVQRIVRKAGVASLGTKVASHWPFPVLVDIVGGRQMYVDLRSVIGRGLFASGTFDIEAIKPALDGLLPGATFIDIGANVGFYSMLALDRVGPHGQIHCFEIDPRPLRPLRKTIARFGIRNIDINEVAVANIDGMLTFTPAGEHGQNRIERDGSGRRAVRSVRLDTWAAEHGLRRLDAIKIDVEGAEKLVLGGARETIARFRPLILCEAAKESTAYFGHEPHDLVGLFGEIGYVTAWLDSVYTPTLVAKPA